MWPARWVVRLVVHLLLLCAIMPIYASELHPLTIVMVESSGNAYFEPIDRRFVIRSQPIRMFIRIRNTSEAPMLIRVTPEKAYFLELKDQDGQTFTVKRKKGTGEEAGDDIRVNFLPGADRIIPVNISRDLWVGVPELKAGQKNQYTVRVVYEETDGRHVYSEPYTLIFNMLESQTPFSKPLVIGGDEPSKVVTEDVKPATCGTGWFCQGGYIVTCYHVVKEHETITVYSVNFPKRKASVVTKNETNDIAVLKLDDGANLPAGIPISQRSISLGERVFIIGYPRSDLLGQSPKLSEGYVSSVLGMHDDPRTLQMSISVQAGNSGGPLLDKKGEVVGMVQSKLSAGALFAWAVNLPQNVNYAVKSTYVQQLIEKLPNDSASRLLPAQEAEMEEIIKRVQDSVVMILAE